jgi:hypothetical protein
LKATGTRPQELRALGQPLQRMEARWGRTMISNGRTGEVKKKRGSSSIWSTPGGLPWNKKKSCFASPCLFVCLFVCLWGSQEDGQVRIPGWGYHLCVSLKKFTDPSFIPPDAEGKHKWPPRVKWPLQLYPKNWK